MNKQSVRIDVERVFDQAEAPDHAREARDFAVDHTTRRTTSFGVIEALVGATRIHGIPEQVRFGNGPGMAAKIVRASLRRVGSKIHVHRT